MDFLLIFFLKVINYYFLKIVFVFYVLICLIVKKKRSENIFNERYKVFCKKFCNKFLSLGKIYIFIIIYNNKENISYKFVFMGICCFICL